MNQSGLDPKALFLLNSRIRFYKALDYLVLFLYVVVVSTSALLADYLIVLAIELTVSSAVAKYPIVAIAFDWFQIGSAFMVFIAAGTHAVFSVVSQVKFEIDTSQEPTLKETLDESNKLL